MPEDVGGFEGRGGLDLVEDTGLALFLDLGEESRQTLVAELKPGERDCWFTTIDCDRPFQSAARLLHFQSQTNKHYEQTKPTPPRNLHPGSCEVERTRDKPLLREH